MADVLKGAESVNIGTTETTVLTAQTGETITFIGVQLANLLDEQIKVTVKRNSAHLLKNCPIPAGSSLLCMGPGGKLVLEAGDTIKVTSDTASSVDAVTSYLEQS